LRRIALVVASMVGLFTPLAGWVAALEHRRALGGTPGHGRMLGATLVLTAASWWLAFTAMTGASAAGAAWGAPLGVAAGMLAWPDLRFVASALLRPGASLGWPAFCARTRGALGSLRAAAWPALGALLAAVWLAHVSGPWALLGWMLAFGLNPLVAVAWGREAVGITAREVSLSITDAMRYLCLGAVVFVLAGAFAEPSPTREGTLAAPGLEARGLPWTIAGTGIRIERDRHGLRVGLEDGGGAGPIRTPTRHPVERVRVRVARDRFEVEAIDTVGATSLVTLDREGVRLDDGSTHRLRRGLGSTRGVVLAALTLLAAFAAYRRKDDQASGS
jgi:hypothetical protein